MVPCEEYSLDIAVRLLSFKIFIKSSRFSGLARLACLSSLTSLTSLTSVSLESNIRNPCSFKNGLVEQNICSAENLICKSVYTASVIKDASVLFQISSYNFS